MLATLAGINKDSKKWCVIKDDNGNVATFAKYKCNSWPAFEFASTQNPPDSKTMRNYVFGACMKGGSSVIDLSVFS
jgi:hypothetical protein